VGVPLVVRLGIIFRFEHVTVRELVFRERVEHVVLAELRVDRGELAGNSV
jgi:hypothetical protein